MANAQQPAAHSWQDKVDTELLDQLNGRTSDRPIEFIVRLDEQADFRNIPAEHAGSKIARGTYVYNQLAHTAETAQAELLATLEAAGAKTQSFVIVNAIHVVAPSSIVPQIAQRADVAYLHANPAVLFDVQGRMAFPFSFPFSFPLSKNKTPNNIEWGISKIGAPLLWADGVNGAGAVIGGQDTGYNWTHPALQNSYRGWNGATADHNYNWHDAISADLNGNNSNLRCGFSLTAPCDDISSTHGTHTMGTMIGLDGANQIGAAPGAKWIGCRNMEEGYGTPTTYINCFNWFLAPTDLNDANPNPAKAPHVINNSWGCPPSEGCNIGNFEIMNIVLENLRAAGIVVVVSAGNSGSSCGSVSTPASIFDGAFAVGATDSNDGIASFSSRGPVNVDGSGRMKPNVTAPGVSVYSASGTSGYSTYSGTSMAGPHVAGAVGLMIAAYPPIAGNVEAIETYLEDTADYIGTGSCGGTTDFNNTYGHGRINAHSAVQAIWNLDLQKTVPTTASVPSRAEITSIGLFTYTLSLTKTGSLITFTNATVTDTLPAGTTFVSASQPVTVSGQSLIWPVGQIGPNDVKELSVTLSIVGLPATTASVSYPAAQVSAASVPMQDSNQPANSLVVFETRRINRDAPTTPHDNRILIGADYAQITYTLNITSPALVPIAINTVLTDTLPAGATLVSSSSPVTVTSSGFIWQLGDLSAEATATLTVSIQISLTGDILPEFSYPAASVAADNTSTSFTPILYFKPYQYWIPLLTN